MKTQKQMILEHLEKYGSLDALTAFTEYGIFTCLHSRITELRNAGHIISTEKISGTSKITGRKWTVANYVYHR